MSVTSETSGSGRRLKTIASEEFSRLAKISARCTPPASGETIDDVAVAQPLFFEVIAQDRRGHQVVDRDVEEALDLRGVQVHRHDPLASPVTLRRLATTLAEIGSRPLVFLSCFAYP